MKMRCRCLVIVICGGLLWIPPSVRASALDDLTNAAGQGLPDVPMPSEPTRVDDTDDRPANQNAQNNQNQSQEQLRQERAEQAHQEELRLQKEEQERQEQLRQQKAEQERLAKLERERQAELRRQAAAAARTQWAAEDEKNGNAFDEILAVPTGARNAADDPNRVDLTDATRFGSTTLHAGKSKVSRRGKPPPLPEPESIVVSHSGEPEIAPPPRWHIDWDGKLTDLGFAYASSYLKSKVDGLASIPELVKDSLDLKKKLNAHVSEYLERLFSVAGQAANPNADDAALAEETWRNFQTSASNFDEDARSGIRNNLATTSGGVVPEDSAAGAGIGIAQAQLQDTEERKKWGSADARGEP